MAMAAIVSVIAVLAALVLAVRGLRSHQLPFEKKAWMAAAWLLVIVVLAFVFDRIGA
ncbi:hypothetical protein D3C83_294410 [compost metagenome]